MALQVIFRLSLLVLPLLSSPLPWEKQCGLACSSSHAHCLATGPEQWNQLPCPETFLTVRQNIKIFLYIFDKILSNPSSFFRMITSVSVMKSCYKGCFCLHTHLTVSSLHFPPALVSPGFISVGQNSYLNTIWTDLTIHLNIQWTSVWSADLSPILAQAKSLRAISNSSAACIDLSAHVGASSEQSPLYPVPHLPPLPSRSSFPLVSLPCFTHHPGWACWDMSDHVILSSPFSQTCPCLYSSPPSSQWSSVSSLLQLLLYKWLVTCCLDLK